MRPHKQVYKRTPVTRPDLLYYFKKKVDAQVKECDKYEECLAHYGTYETPEVSAMGGCWFSTCSCRPPWYLKMMEEAE